MAFKKKKRKKKKSFFSIYRVFKICGHNYPMKSKESALHNTFHQRSVDSRVYIVHPVFRASGCKMTDTDSWTDIQHMLLPLYLHYSDNKVREPGGLCPRKVDVIAHDFRNEWPFSKRAIRSP